MWLVTNVSTFICHYFYGLTTICCMSIWLKVTPLQNLSTENIAQLSRLLPDLSKAANGSLGRCKFETIQSHEWYQFHSKAEWAVDSLGLWGVRPTLLMTFMLHVYSCWKAAILRHNCKVNLASSTWHPHFVCPRHVSRDNRDGAGL